MRKIIGLSIAVVLSLLAAMGMLCAHVDHYVGTGIAVCAILVGTAIARPRRSATH
jgi:hypothetical protein